VTEGTFINAHKVLVIPLVAALMLWFGNYTVESWLYLAMHGTYAVLWLLKQAWYPDRRFSVQRPLWIGVLFVFLPLASYYVAPFMLITRRVALPEWVLAASVSLYTFGIFFHYVADAQKFYTLQAGRGLIQDGLFSHTRNPNYFGEILIYAAFATLAAHWLPFAILAVWAVALFGRGMLAKEKILAGYPGYAAYRARSWPLLPRPW
jgi:protein-S-isoprenylcysteine O-methyltransferase Ste14